MENEKMPITVAISSLGNSYRKIRLPKWERAIRYVILLQDAPEDLNDDWFDRSDVQVFKLEGRGLSRSRNSALSEVNSGHILFSDDDIELKAEGILALSSELATRCEYSFAVGWREERFPSTGRFSNSYELTRFSTGRVCAPEFMIDVDAFREKNIKFDNDFGLGAQFGVGEEYVFLTDALRAGLRGLACPIITGSHPAESTGDHWAEAKLLRARAAVLKRVFGPWHTVIRMAYALRHRRKFQSYGDLGRFVLGQFSNS